MCICLVRNQSLTNLTVYIQDIHIYVQVAHNFDTFYATKLKLGVVFTQTKTLDFMVELPLGRVRSQNV